MVRLLAAACVLLAVGFAAYAGSFYATRSALAHYSDCDPSAPWTFNPCNGDPPAQLPRYYAEQFGNTAYSAGHSNGINGFISSQYVALHDTSQQDFMANWIGMTKDFGTVEWAQTGFIEGKLPNGYWRTTPTIYTENQSLCYGHSFVERSTPPGNPRYNEYFRASWAGAWGSCPGVVPCISGSSDAGRPSPPLTWASCLFHPPDSTQ